MKLNLRYIQVPRILLLFAILLIVIVLTLLSIGCRKTDREINRGEEIREVTRDSAITRLPPATVTSQRIDWGLYAIKFEGHTYLWEMDGFLLHSASCEGSHE
jgi:hypothetical protein